jgi:hypothetical protein
MDDETVNPDDQTIIVNVKGVSKKSWESAKKLAFKRDESMGALVSQGLDKLIPIEPRGTTMDVVVAVPENDTKLIPKPANPDYISTRELLQIGAGYQDLKAVPGLRSLIAERLRAMRGLPPAKPRERPAPRLRITSGAGEGTGSERQADH